MSLQEEQQCWPTGSVLSDGDINQGQEGLVEQTEQPWEPIGCWD